MFEYKIKLPFKIESCNCCVFRHEMLCTENVQSIDKLTGVVSITRITSSCMLTNLPVTYSEPVEGYKSKCPLKDNIVELKSDIKL